MIKLISKIRTVLTKVFFQPIRVFCFHHVCEKYDEESMYLCDWMSINDFKQQIDNLRDKGYQFISLTDAYNHLKKDLFRRKKYAVITFDDGFKSLLEIIPWMISEKVPITLFINGKYLDGVSYRENINEQYIDLETLFSLKDSLIEIGHHGWEHIPVTKMEESEFIDSITKNIKLISTHPRYVPFWAYTYGNHNERYDDILYQENLVIVLMDGQKNYNNKKSIHRELI